VSGTLRSERVQRVLAELRRQAEMEDPPAKARVRAREQELGGRVYGRERGALYGAAASLAITPEVGELLCVLALARRARTVVEFGASLGFSTIHLASAVCDLGGGVVISTEIEPEKARLAKENLAAAGLADVVDLRVGDALETLRDVRDIELLFLDGWNNLYLAALDLLEPALAPGALVVADLSEDDPEQLPYCERMHDPEGGYLTVDVPLDAGVVVSVRTAPQSIRSN
jgi:predicted O-methyltransferase YrrM